MKISSYKLLFNIFSYLSDKTGGAQFFVKYKLMLGTLIIGVTGSVASAKAQNKQIIIADDDSIVVRQQVTCYKPAMPQTRIMEIKGNVKDKSGEEIIGANIFVKDPSTGVVTDLDGNFSIRAKTTDVLTIRYVGYKTKEIPVSQLSIRKINEIILEEDDTQILCYVVVNSTGIQKDIREAAKGDNIQGNITDQNGEPLYGVSIVAKGTTNGTITDSLGNFTIKVKPKDILQFSYIGFKQLEMKVSEMKDGFNKIVLEEDDFVLCYEVVVVRAPYHDDIYRKTYKERTKLPYGEVQKNRFRLWASSKTLRNGSTRM